MGVPVPDYVELHANSAFSFLEGSSLPEDLARTAAELGLGALALCDVQGVYGAPRAHQAAKKAGIRALVGAELRLEVPAALPADGPPPAPTPGSSLPRVTVLAASRAGYKNLCRLITAGNLRRPKGEGRIDLDALAAHAEGLVCLTGGDEGWLAAGWEAGGLEEARRRLRALHGIFPGRLHVELQRHLRRDEERRNRAVLALAREMKLPLLAANGVRYAKPRDKELLDVLTCVRLGCTLDGSGKRLEPQRERHLKTAAAMKALFSDLPEAVRNSVALAESLDFTLADLGYRFPDYPLPAGETPMSYLRKLSWESAAKRFDPLGPRERAQIEHELAIIEKLDLAGYFLIVWDIVQFCRREKIMVQGRGSAANSAVCYALGITAVDPVRMELLFERFLSEERGEWPDIDLDLPSGEQRERVIQHLYEKYGRHAAAMTANVVTYRSRSAMREAAKVFGYTPELVDTLGKRLGSISIEEWHADPKMLPGELRQCGVDPAEPRVRRLVRAWLAMQNLPRHLGQHSGGMVVARGRLDEVVPLEPASMPGRVVIQWDKDDCADLGLIKVDLLGLGMLAALEEALPMIEKHENKKVDLAHLPDDPKVYDMLQKADTVGVFQLESRAQMASLPRHAPVRFYDVVVQVAIIRPGPIVGRMVHPFFDRRSGKVPVEYPHPCLEPILRRTLGIPLFQEQVLKMAMAAAGFSGGEAEELRRAMGFKRSVERMDSIVARLHAGMEKKGIAPKAREQIVHMITAFALYGFPESHAASFALIAYASAWLKYHHPAAFFASLLNAWPMGFYHPATLVKDAQRRGVEMLPVDVTRSNFKCRWENGGVRLGLRFVQGLREGAGRRIEEERAKAPFRDAADAARRAGLQADELERLADAGAFCAFGLTRRAALWQAAQIAAPKGPLFEGLPASEGSPLPEMSPEEETLADYRSAQMTTGPHLVEHLRPRLKAQGIRSAAELESLPNGSYVKSAGAVIVRQRPDTAMGFVFLTLEDETGMVQAIVNPKLFRDQRHVILGYPGLIVEGPLQKQDGTLSIKAARFAPLSLGGSVPSHDFR
ncbi:MAG: error-prone DNA polymerase [Elusimicrobia bacterium]|nr:error-prone DNA polymerase [Elusimicrobiota bacterium]